MQKYHIPGLVIGLTLSALFSVSGHAAVPDRDGMIDIDVSAFVPELCVTDVTVFLDGREVCTLERDFDDPAKDYHEHIRVKAGVYAASVCSYTDSANRYILEPDAAVLDTEKTDSICVLVLEDPSPQTSEYAPENDVISETVVAEPFRLDLTDGSGGARIIFSSDIYGLVDEADIVLSGEDARYSIPLFAEHGFQTEALVPEGVYAVSDVCTLRQTEDNFLMDGSTYRWTIDGGVPDYVEVHGGAETVLSGLQIEVNDGSGFVPLDCERIIRLAAADRQAVLDYNARLSSPPVSDGLSYTEPGMAETGAAGVDTKSGDTVSVSTGESSSGTSESAVSSDAEPAGESVPDRLKKMNPAALFAIPAIAVIFLRLMVSLVSYGFKKTLKKGKGSYGEQDAE